MLGRIAGPDEIELLTEHEAAAERPPGISGYENCNSATGWCVNKKVTFGLSS